MHVALRTSIVAMANLDVSSKIFPLWDPTMIIRGISMLQAMQAYDVKSLEAAKLEVLQTNMFSGSIVAESAKIACVPTNAAITPTSLPIPQFEILKGLLEKTTVDPVKNPQAHIEVIKYAHTLSRSGDNIAAVALLKSYLEYHSSVVPSISSVAPFRLQALWGLIAAQLCCGSFLEAVRSFIQLDSALDVAEEEARKARAAGKIVKKAEQDPVFVLSQQRTWLAAWIMEPLFGSLFVTVDDENDRRASTAAVEATRNLMELLVAERNLAPVARYAPQLLRYVVAGILLTHRKLRGPYVQDPKNLVALLTASTDIAEDPIVAFYVASLTATNNTSALLNTAIAAVQADLVLHNVAGRICTAMRAKTLDVICKLSDFTPIAEITTALCLEGKAGVEELLASKSARAASLEARVENGSITAARPVTDLKLCVRSKLTAFNSRANAILTSEYAGLNTTTEEN